MPWEFLAPIVFAASFAQAATGIGFGVIAGPFLLHAYGYERAVVETALYSIAVAAVCSATSLRAVAWRPAALLAGMLPAGLVAGALLVSVVSEGVIVAAFGILLCTLGSTLLRREWHAGAPAVSPPVLRRGLLPAAFVAGISAYLFAAPGPVAAWGLARSDLSVQALRGTLAVYFIVAYGVLAAAFGVLGRLAAVEWTVFGWMAVACVAGSMTGAFHGNRFTARMLRIAIGAIIGLSGASTLLVLLWRSASLA